MRYLALVGLAAVVVFVPSLSAAAPLVDGYSVDAAVVPFDHVSQDGCVHTTGQLAAVFSLSYPNPTFTGIIVSGSRRDLCQGSSQIIYGTSHEGFFVLGVVFARAEGLVLTGDGMHPTPITFEFDLNWLGQGRTDRTCSSASDPSHAELTCNVHRSALLQGELTIDGEPVALSGATFVQRTVGHVTF
jgi:hypothetical protein